MADKELSAPLVLVVDDEQDLLENLSEWLLSTGYRVLTAKNGFEALSLLRSERVEVVVTDLKMPGMSGLDLLSLIKGLDPTIEVIILTGQGTIDDAIMALRDGRAADFLKKPLEDPFALNLAIERTRIRSLKAADPAPLPAPAPKLSGFESLNRREMDILTLLANGYETKAIASMCALTEKTIRNYLSVIYSKLNVTNRTQAILYCQKQGLTSNAVLLDPSPR